MKCPACGGEIRVKDVVHTPDNKIMRLRQCKKCGNLFHTVEFKVLWDEYYAKEWNTYYRKKKGNRDESTL